MTWLDEAGYADLAIANRNLAAVVARHKAMFFAEKAADRSGIDYSAAVGGSLCLVPEGTAHGALEDDYHRMVEDGLLFDEAEPFDELMAHCDALARRANETARRSR